MNTPETPSKPLAPQTGETTPLVPARFGRRAAAPPVAPVLHPATGELLDLAFADDIELAKQRVDVIELKSRLSEYAAAIDEELIYRMDRENVRSMHAGPYLLKVPAPDLVQWDTAELGVILEALVDDSRLSRGAAQKALEVHVTYKAKTTELKKLLNHADTEVRTAIAACRTERPNTARRVSVSTSTSPNHPSTK